VPLPLGERRSWGHGAVDGGPPTRDDGWPWAQMVSIHDIIRAAGDDECSVRMRHDGALTRLAPARGTMR
jgi:hypothetical protein